MQRELCMATFLDLLEHDHAAPPDWALPITSVFWRDEPVNDLLPAEEVRPACPSSVTTLRRGSAVQGHER